PVVLDLRLAAAVLPDVGRLHEDVPGADRDDRLVEVRPRQRPALRQLHGALRLRADGRARGEQVAEAERARARRASLSWTSRLSCANTRRRPTASASWRPTRAPSGLRTSASASWRRRPGRG